VLNLFCIKAPFIFSYRLCNNIEDLLSQPANTPLLKREGEETIVAVYLYAQKKIIAVKKLF